MGWNSITVLTSSRSGDQRAIARRLLLDAAAVLIPGAAFTLEHTPSGQPYLQCPAFDSGTISPDRLRGSSLPSKRPVPSGNLHVSVSHTIGLTAVALTGLGPVGIDAEAQRTLDAVGLAQRWYPPSEVDWLTQLPTQAQADGFLTLWVAKESVGKALGTGLRDGALHRPVPASAIRGPAHVDAPVPASTQQGQRRSGAVAQGDLHPVPDLPGLAVGAVRLGSGHRLGIAGPEGAHFAVFSTD